MTIFERIRGKIDSYLTKKRKYPSLAEQARPQLSVTPNVRTQTSTPAVKSNQIISDAVVKRELRPFFEPTAQKAGGVYTSKVRPRDFVRELPEALAAVVGRPLIRSAVAITNPINKRDPFAEYTPENAFEQSLLGTKEPVSLYSVGKEGRVAFGGDAKKKRPVFDYTLGLLLAGLDVAPDGGAKKQAAKVGIKATKGVFEGFTDVSTKLLEKLKGRSTVSKQFISDLTNSPDLKQAERDLIRNTLADEADTISVPDFANKVKTELLPLRATKPEGDIPFDAGDDFTGPAPRYESITLPDELRGPVANYEERIYRSPIKTSAGGIHFSDEAVDDYFAHTRIEDLPGKGKTYWDDKMAAPLRPSDSRGKHSNYEVGTTRRVIEIQSDLFQKGRLEGETGQPWREAVNKLERENEDYVFAKGISKEEHAKRLKLYQDRVEKVKKEAIAARQTELSKLEPYRNTWHERVIREEVKQAVIDGKTKLQFPTGETAMKIEGLGDTRQFFSNYHDSIPLTPEKLKVGETMYHGGNQPWIITDVLGDGKFKAVPKDRLETALEDAGVAADSLDTSDWVSYASHHLKDELDNLHETFDISGKIDTNNPIYRFYEKEVGKYLTNKYGAKLVTDAQGVKWWEVDLRNVPKNAPVEAFGGLAGIEQDEEGNLSFDPKKALFGVAGTAAFSRGKKIVGKVTQNGKEISLNKSGDLDIPRVNPALKYTDEGIPLALNKKQKEIFAKGQRPSSAGATSISGRVSEISRESEQSLSRPTVSSQKLNPSSNDGNRPSILKGIRNQEVIPPGSFPGARATYSDRLTDQKPTSRTSLQVEEGESKSLEIAARQHQQEAKSRFGIDIPSLGVIVDAKKTPVNSKVGYHDYLRTPDRVLKKIGLGKEAEYIRQQYENYTIELPQNIEKITAWSKQVPKESNERIFKWLDGQAITLRPEEAKVAREIKSWLAEWADRLGLPKSERIAEYITHIFDDQLIKKEFDEDLAKIIRDKIPGSTYNPFLERRLGTKGYVQDTWRALDAYVKRATRKVHMDPALEKLEAVSERLEESQWDYVKKLVDKINLRPSKGENLVDNTLKQTPFIGYRFGQRPSLRLTNTLRRWGYRGTLGLNLGSAIRNMSQSVNTLSTIGEKYTGIGLMKLLSQGTDELKKMGVLADNIIQDRSIRATKQTLQKIDKGLWAFFDTAEKINRGIAYYGAKSKALKEGKSVEEAIDYAKKIVRDTQFQYGPLDTPLAMQGAGVKLFTQFMTYPVKQSEFLIEKLTQKDVKGLLRYGIYSSAFVYTVGQALGMKPEEAIPFYDQVTGDRKFGLPPGPKFLWEVVSALTGRKNDYGQERDLKEKIDDVKNAVVPILPGGVQLKKTIQGSQAISRDGVYDKADRKLFEQGDSIPKRAQSLLFGKYASKEAREYYNQKGKESKDPYDKAIKSDKEKDDAAKKAFRPTYDRIRTLSKENEVEARALLESLTENEYEMYKSMKKADKAKETLETQRRIYPLFVRIQELREAGDTEEARALLETLTDDEYRAYELLKEKLK